MTSRKKIRNNLQIVLMRPRHAGNIGAAARAMKNMGFTKLVLVDPAPYDVPETYMMGWNSEDIIRKAKVYPDLKKALSDYHFVIGMTRRKGKGRDNQYPIENQIDEMITVANSGKVAILFGTESTGLLNKELKECHKLCFLDTGTIFPSLNLAQAVLVVCSELHKRIRKEISYSSLRLAKKEHLDHMYHHIDQILDLLGYGIKGNRPLREQILKRIKVIFSRSLLERKDVQMIRGLCQQIEKKKGKKRNEKEGSTGFH